MPLTFLWEVLGGLGLFLLGMKSMSEGLQKLAGERLRHFVEKVTGNRFTAAFAGSCLASLLQSGSAASILVISFINAGIISLYQALCVLLGTGIGATVAIQLIAFRVSAIALPAIFLGVVLRLFVRQRRWVNLGEMLLGTGLVFLGLQMMESGFLPIKQNTLFQGIHSSLLNWRISSLLLGALVTFLVQSSSAAAGIVIAVTGSGLFGFEAGVAMIVGEVLGTSLIAAIASVSGTIAAKRTALIYFAMNILAVTLVLIFFPAFLRIVMLVTPGAHADVNGTVGGFFQSNHALFRSLANAHTVFSLLNALMFLPLIGFFARSAASILPSREGEGDYEARCKFIDHRVVDTPSIALLQANNELQRMAEIAGSMYADVAEQFRSFDTRRSARIQQKEQVLDILQREISAFLVLLSRRSFNVDNAMELPILLHIVNNLEHIGDQCEALLEFLQRKKDRKVIFSPAAMSELKEMAQKVGGMVTLAVDTLGKASDDDLKKGRLLKDHINDQQELMGSRHVDRLTKGDCTVLAGVMYGDMAAAFVKIAEYSFNILKTERELI